MHIQHCAESTILVYCNFTNFLANIRIQFGLSDGLMNNRIIKQIDFVPIVRKSSQHCNPHKRDYHAYEVLFELQTFHIIVMNIIIIWLFFISILTQIDAFDFDKKFEKLFKGELGGYLSVNDTYNFIQQITKQEPKLIIPLTTIGHSINNNSIQMMGITNSKQVDVEFKKISNNTNKQFNPSKRKSIIDIIKMCNEKDQINFLLESCVVWFIPFTNIDSVLEMEKIWRSGHKDFDNRVMFRKNRNAKSKGQCGGVTLYQGVDLNRNFDVVWGSLKIRDSCAQQYPGQSPFSEPQTKAIKNLYEEHNIVLMIDFHSYGNNWIYPYSYDSTGKLINENETQSRFYSDLNIQLKNIGAKMDTAWNYLNYVTDGVYFDWAQSKGTFALVYEVGDQFVDSPNVIRKNVEISLPSVELVLLKSSYGFKFICQDQIGNTRIGEIGLESLSIIPLKIRIQEILYWRFIDQDNKNQNTTLLLQPLGRIVLGINMGTKQISLEIQSGTKQIYTKLVKVNQRLSSCNIYKSSISMIVAVILAAIILLIVSIIAMIKLIKDRQEKKKRNKEVKESELSRIKYQTVDSQQI